MAQQLCRRLLMSLDRLISNRACATHEFIAQMLGVRREGVTAIAEKLRDEGMITHNRGRIAVLDRPAVEARVCECYWAIEEECNRQFSSPD